jgi:acyl-ACP thioesterase
MIDTETRQPQDILEIHDGEIVNWIETEKECPIEKSSRVKMSDKAVLVREIDTYYNDVDVNGHVNSIKYIEHILDLFSIDFYRENKIKRFEIAYVAESYGGDRLSFWQEQTGDNEYCIRITKLSEDGEKTIEVCRCKVVFVKN